MDEGAVKSQQWRQSGARRRTERYNDACFSSFDGRDRAATWIIGIVVTAAIRLGKVCVLAELALLESACPPTELTATLTPPA